MAKREHSGIVLWPEYFDSNLTRKQGRRVRKDLSIPSPTSEEIFHACRRIGLNPNLEKDKAFPSRWFDPKGCVKVERKYKKSETIEKVAAKILTKRR